MMLTIHAAFPSHRSDLQKQFEMADVVPSSTPHEATLRTFTNFPYLPPEIRREIWSYILPASRVIHITSLRHRKCFIEKRADSVLLRICQESRAIASERLKLSFKPHLRHPIYFDSSCDILLMQSTRVLDMFFQGTDQEITEEVTNVKVVALMMPSLSPEARMNVISTFLHRSVIIYALAKAAARFGNLQKVILLPSNPEEALEPDFHDRIQAKMRSNYGENRDPYAVSRREFLKDEDGRIPITEVMSAVDFWNRFDRH